MVGTYRPRGEKEEAESVESKGLPWVLFKCYKVHKLTKAGQRKRTQQEHPDADTKPMKPSTESSSPKSKESAIIPRPDGKPLHRRCIGSQSQELLRQFTKTAYRSYMLGDPTADHLLTLSKVNVFRAFSMIMSVMGMAWDPDWMHDDALSPFTTLRPGVAEDTSLPVALRPTKLQQTLSHHPWLDFFPLPKMRDNLLRAGETFDDEDLCVDIMGFWDMSSDSCSMLVWGEPTDPRSWEVTENFLRKWPWVVRGCPELLQSTNYWRRQRGEMMIFRYL